MVCAPCAPCAPCSNLSSDFAPDQDSGEVAASEVMLLALRRELPNFQAMLYSELEFYDVGSVGWVTKLLPLLT